jgi:hypothetical protein
MEVADRDNLLRDMRVYAAALLRLLNAPVYPLDYRATVQQISAIVGRYQQQAGDKFDFGPSLEAAQRLAETLDRFYEEAEGLADRPVDDPAVRQLNASQRLLARSLVTTVYSQAGRFRQDPARSYPPLPEFLPAQELASVEAGSDRHNVLRVDLTRAQNRLVWAMRQAEHRIAERLS